MALDIRSIRFAPDHVAVGFALNLLNQGTVPATGLMVRIALNQGSAMTEPVLSRFFDGAGGGVLRDDIALAVGAGEELSTEVMLPRAAIEPLMIGGRSEEHTSELQSLMRISYAVFCLKKKKE